MHIHSYGHISLWSYQTKYTFSEYFETYYDCCLMIPLQHIPAGTYIQTISHDTKGCYIAFLYNNESYFMYHSTLCVDEHGHKYFDKADGDGNEF